MLIRKVSWICWGIGLLLSVSCNLSWALTQPMKPDTGWGSSQHYICTGKCYTRTEWEKTSSPEHVFLFSPTKLKHEDSAPVVIFMHGFFAISPDSYEEHISHLTRQGYFVIFPQFQAGSWAMIKDVGVLKETDQTDWLRHAIASTKRVLESLGAKAEMDELYAYGHSLGAMMLLGWDHEGGPRLKGMVLANPELSTKEGLPAFVKPLVRIKEMPWEDMAHAITGDVIVLTGQDDDIAFPDKARAIARHATNARTNAMYIAASDKHSGETIKADHFTPLTNAAFFENLQWMMNLFGGKIQLNTYDYRYYFASMDAMLHGDLDFQAHLGHWSDGHPFAGLSRGY